MVIAKKKTVCAVEMKNITKTFGNGSIVANDDVSFSVYQNEIHAIVGENGAGKSTLMSILFGIYLPDSGEVKINQQVVHFKSAQDASKAGIGMVHQHFKLVHNYTLLENIILGAEITKRGFLDKKTAYEKISAIANQYDLPVNLRQRVSESSVGEQQRAEILKLLYREANILIFDEPTAVLSDKEIDGFLKMILFFKKLGKTIIIITHKLNEVKLVADRATVIRQGKVIDTFNVKKTSVQQLANCMVGTKLSKFVNPLSKVEHELTPMVLNVQNLSLKKISEPSIWAVKNVSFDVRAGEILGIAGVEGNGQSELSLALSGLLKPSNGKISFYAQNDKEPIAIERSSIKQLYESGVSHVPEDRHKYGLILDETVAMNIVAPEIDKPLFSHAGFLRFQNIKYYSKMLCANFDVRGAAGGKSIARSLSGGNQQKLVLGRELSRAHKLIIIVQPTRGLDLGAIQFIHKKIVEDAKKGTAIILISYELDEIFDLATRIMVMDNGKIVYHGSTKNTTRKMIGKFMSSSEEHDQMRGI